MSKLPSLLSECLAVPSDEGQELAASILTRYGYDIERDDTPESGFCYGAGAIPVLLVAHTDTVWDRPPTTIYHDAAKRVIFGGSGIGADDRCGVYAIAELLRRGLRPHVLFTDGEETGGRGAQCAAYLLAAPEVNVMVQLDRAGANDAVYYQCDAPALRSYVGRFGFRAAIGSYTDIVELMPAWGIAGVNLSVGYYGQHTEGERVHLAELERTIERVARMLRKPPKRRIPFATFPRRKDKDVWPMEVSDALTIDDWNEWGANGSQR